MSDRSPVTSLTMAYIIYGLLWGRNFDDIPVYTKRGQSVHSLAVLSVRLWL